jgi:hypothetical protein
MQQLYDAIESVLDTAQPGSERHAVSVDAVALKSLRTAAERRGPGFDYLGAPYSHDDPSVREMRFQQISAAAACLMRQGHIVFSPISHSHPCAVFGTLPTDWAYWRPFVSAFLGLANRLLVLQLPGWRESAGLKAEIAMAADFGIPVVMLHPRTLGMPIGERREMRQISTQRHERG